MHLRCSCRFMWQMCAYIPTTLPRDDKALQVLPAQLSSSFLLETFIHAKEKPTMVQWIELLTKQFNQCPSACEVWCYVWYVESWSLTLPGLNGILKHCNMGNSFTTLFYNYATINILHFRTVEFLVYIYPLRSLSCERIINSQFIHPM